MVSLSPVTKKILETCFLCLHSKGNNLVKLSEGKGHIFGHLTTEYHLQKALTVAVLTEEVTLNGG